MVFYSKEMQRICGSCEAKLETAFFRCFDCGKVVHCSNCDPRGSDEDRVSPCGTHDRPSCPRGNFPSRGRGFDRHPSHLSCPRGRFAVRGGHFDPRPYSPYDRPTFASIGPMAPFQTISRGRGFGPRGFGGFPPRCPFPETFGSPAEDFSSMMHGPGRGGFAPFAGAFRGGAGFPRGIPNAGLARGCGKCRVRGGFPPYFGVRGMGCGECNHVNVFPEMIGENIHYHRGEPHPGEDRDPRGEPCPRADHDPRGQISPGADCSDDQENIPETRGQTHGEPDVADHEG